MKTLSTSVQRQQTKVQFANAQDYLNYELGNAQRRLPPLYARLLSFSICALVGVRSPGQPSAKSMKSLRLPDR